ncbi:hypothetical protein JCM10450v2_000323 [Rhodotorula kratochvilovae]
MLPRSPPLAPARRLHVLLIALAALLFHVWLAGKLAGVQASLAATLGGDDDGSLGGGGRGGDDARDLEGVEWRRLEGVRALLGIGRLWSWSSAGVAAVGAYGLLKDRLPLLRLFMLNSFLSLSLDLLLLALILVLLTVSSTSSSSTHGLATTLCQALSSAPAASSSLSLSFGLPDLLGLSLEACEDRFEGVVVSALGTLAVVEGLRAWGAIKILGFYTARASPRGGRSRRNGGAGEQDSLHSDRFYDSPAEVELDAPGGLGRSSSGKKKRRDSHSGRRERSSSASSAHGGGGRRRDETRIFLLPRPEDRGLRPGEGEGDVPLLALTASSPIRTSFPPSVQGLQPPGVVTTEREGKRVLVYAPVMVSPEEARSLGATELVLHGPGRTYPPPPHRSPGSSTASSAHRTPRSRSSTITPASSTASTSSGTLVLDTAALARPPAPLLRQDSDDVPTPVAPRQPQMGAQVVREEVNGRAKRA